MSIQEFAGWYFDIKDVVAVKRELHPATGEGHQAFLKGMKEPIFFPKGLGVPFMDAYLNQDDQFEICPECSKKLIRTVAGWVCGCPS